MSILEKLKVKPVPNKIEQIKIKIAEPMIEEKVEIQTKIIDKTKDNLINRDEFIKKLNTVVVNKNIQPSISIVSVPTPVKKVKKLPKKLKLVSEFSEPKEMKAIVRRTPKPKMDIITDNIDMNKVIGDATIISRLPKKDQKVFQNTI